MPQTANKRFAARLESLGEAMALVTDCAKKTGFDQKRLMDIELALEEALVNIVNHAYLDRDDGYFEISCSSGKEMFVMEIRDEGKPFDVMSLKEPDLTQEIAERQIGGLGVFLIRKLMDDVRYRREGKLNILELCVNLTQQQGD